MSPHAGRVAIPRDVPGRDLIVASWWGTVVFVVSAVAGVVGPGPVRLAAVVVALALFAVGIVLFLWAFAISVERSRFELLSVAGIYFLAGDVADPRVRRHLLAALTVQSVVAFATAGARPFTAAAFGILVPMFGLGVAGRWAAQHGSFPKREPEYRRPRRRGRVAGPGDTTVDDSGEAIADG